MDETEYVWVDYDPSWLLPLAEKAFPDEPWLLESIKRCTKAMRKHAEAERLYTTYFVNPKEIDPSKPQWRFKTNKVIRVWSEGDIVLDILEGNLVGAIEFGIFPPQTRSNLEVAAILQRRNIKLVK
jgi:hypothetical protein